MCCCSPNLGLVIPTMALGGDGTANISRGRWRLFRHNPDTLMTTRAITATTTAGLEANEAISAIGGEDDDKAVLDTNFKVRGIENLRVVDASVFPRIPGLFILSSVYMISEKASDVVIAKYS